MVTLRRCHVVKPAEPTPNHRLELSESDQVTPTTHAPTIYFYRPSGDTVNSAIEIMREALSKALVKFYPLAGRLYRINDDRLELDCNALGAYLIEAISETRIEDYGDFEPTPEIRKLVPSIDYTNTPIHEQPLILVQLTKLQCGGVSIGMAISHSVVDGQSALQFVSYWAKLARGEKVDITPVYDRRALQETENMGRFHHDEFDPPPILIGKPDEKEERMKETMVAMLKLSKVQVAKLKNKANEGRTDDMSQEYSRYEAITGHMWRAVCKARGHANEQPTKLRVIVDCRNRLCPPLSPMYFGNCIFPTTPTSRSGELVSKPLGYAAGKIREAVNKMTDEYVRSSIGFLKSQPDLDPFRTSFHTVGCTKGIFFGNPNLAVTSWMGLPVYDADFGWGKPIHMGPASPGFDGMCFLIPSSGDGGGSFTVALRLQVAHMNAFKKFFYEDI